jgi:hypothetical protein
MENSTKKCLMCAETIKLEAKVCHFRRARFEIKTTGYCAAGYERRTKTTIVFSVDPN